MASLLTRIAQAANPSSSERTTYRDHDVESAVLRNVRQILNTRAGSALTVPDYGVVQLSELIHDFPDAIGIMQRAIKATLAAHEPRL
ncbi:MAG: type VI secretion system baseplate subunit TssE, partial [Polyangiaceae bacterium]